MGNEIQVAIIGGGASGTISAIQLMQQLKVKAKIFFIEKKKEYIYRGAAYSSRLSYEPLNVVAGRMSLYNHSHDDFFHWLKENKQTETGEEITKDSYVSRRWFGDYLTDRINQAAAGSGSAKLEVINAEVLDINSDNGYRLLLSNETTIHADYLIFATGNETPADVLSTKTITVLGEMYVSNPWFGNTLEKVKSTDDVLIIGTGLTMVDHVVSLQKNNHQGKIYCLSRNGYLPLEHTDIQAFSFEIKEEPKDIYELFRLLKAKIKEAGAENIEWQNVLDAVRPHTTRLWNNLSIKERKYFLNRLKTYWEIHRHRMPSASANAIKQMMAKGQLVLLAGNIIGAELLNGKIAFKYSSKGESKTNSLQIDFVINCTGPSSDYYKCGNSLITNLLNKGLMYQDELKLGIQTGAQGEILTNNGTALQNAFAIGPLRKATEWETTAIREIRTQAESVAQLIAAKANSNTEILLETGT